MMILLLHSTLTREFFTMSYKYIIYIMYVVICIERVVETIIKMSVYMLSLSFVGYFDPLRSLLIITIHFASFIFKITLLCFLEILKFVLL